MTNLLPIEYQKKIKREYAARLIAVSLFFLSGVLIFSAALLLSSFITVSAARESLSSYGSVLSSGQSSPEERKAALSEIKRKMNILSSEDGVSVARDIIAAAARKSGRISLRGFHYSSSGEEGSTMRISGVAPDRESLRSFSRALEDERLFGDVEVPISNFVRESDLEFSLTLVVGK